MGIFGRKKKNHNDTPFPAPPTEAVNLPLLILEDRKNRVELWPTKLVISRHGLMNAVNIGLTGEKDIYLANITGIQVKKPGMTTGYIQFVTRGSQDNKGGVTGAVTDENTVIFNGKKNYEIALQMKTRIEEFVHQPIGSVVTTGSTADELLKLASLREQGLLTEEEFQSEKKKLIG